MKTLFLVTLMTFFTFSAQASGIPGVISDDESKDIMCKTENVKDHMRQMGVLISDLGAFVDDIIKNKYQPDVRGAIIERAQLLRVHLSSVMVLTPSKISSIDPNNPQRAKLIFQEYIARVQWKTITLEKELLALPENPFTQQAERVKIANLLLEINDIVTAAHQQFRN